MYDRTALGKRISEYRKRAGLTQEKLAEQIGKSDIHISHLEKGRVSVSIECFVDLCNALNVTPNDLLFGQFQKDFSESYGELSPAEHTLVDNFIHSLRDVSRLYGAGGRADRPPDPRRR